PLWKTVYQFLKRLNIKLPYDPAILLVGIYPRQMKTYAHETPCLAKSWKEPKCLSNDEWIKKMWFIYTMEYYTAIRKNEVWPFVAMWMELEGVMLSE
ncbi:LORF2 protein, partial [Crocuta crocuta]